MITVWGVRFVSETIKKVLTYCSGFQCPTGGSGGIGEPSLIMWQCFVAAICNLRWLINYKWQQTNKIGTSGKCDNMMFPVSCALDIVDITTSVYGKFNSFNRFPVHSAWFLPKLVRTLSSSVFPSTSYCPWRINSKWRMAVGFFFSIASFSSLSPFSFLILRGCTRLWGDLLQHDLNTCIWIVLGISVGLCGDVCVKRNV